VKVALYSFGGPAGQIAVMHRILVEEKRWVTENRFLHALNYCMLLPGPEAQQLATYMGWLFHKTRGGLVAGTLFILPGFISVLGLSLLYAGFQNTNFLESLFFGLKAAVMAVVLQAVIHIGRRVLKNEVLVILAVSAFVTIFFFNVPFPFIVLGAGTVGYFGGKIGSEKFTVIKDHQSQQNYETPSMGRALRVAMGGLLLWFGPLVLLSVVLGINNVYVTEGIFFSKTAVVTFGGAYAVLAYMAQEAVHTFGWLKPSEMLDGLGMAETTPGPLIQVVQFVGFMGAYRNPGTLDPWVAGLLGSLVTTWVTFVPCFLWIFLGAPYIERLRGNKSLNAVLSSITAAVVGVVLNLALWFSVHASFGTVNEIHTFGLRLLVPVWQTVKVGSLLISTGAFVALFRYKVSMIKTLGFSTALGFLTHVIFGN